MKGADGLTKHSVAAMRMASAGNISFMPSGTTFSGPLVSDGDTAYMDSVNASSFYASPLSESGAKVRSIVNADTEMTGLVRCRLLQMDDGTAAVYETFTNHIIRGLGFLSEGHVSIKAGADTAFKGPLNHTGMGLIRMTADAHAMFTGDYKGEAKGGRNLLQLEEVDWKKGTAGLVSHGVAALSFESAGNISFHLSVTNFEGPLNSDGATAYLNSINASIVFASPVDLAEAGVLTEFQEDRFSCRRLLQVGSDGNSKYEDSTNHLVGGLGFLSKGNVSITAGAAATFKGPPHR